MHLLRSIYVVSRLNNLIPKLIDPELTGINTFAQFWGNNKVYLFPLLGI